MALRIAHSGLCFVSVLSEKGSYSILEHQKCYGAHLPPRASLPDAHMIRLVAPGYVALSVVGKKQICGGVTITPNLMTFLSPLIPPDHPTSRVKNFGCCLRKQRRQARVGKRRAETGEERRVGDRPAQTFAALAIFSRAITVAEQFFRHVSLLFRTRASCGI